MGSDLLIIMKTMKKVFAVIFIVGTLVVLTLSKNTGAYVHDPAGDKALPYKHDPSGDTGLPYKHDARGDKALPYKHDSSGDKGLPYKKDSNVGKVPVPRN